MRPSQDTTIYGLLRDGARAWPDRVLVHLESGECWTWDQALREGARAANALAAKGVRRGDRVMLPLPNGATWLRAWWGAALLGAVFIPANPNLRGQLLADVCELVSPSAIVAEEDIGGLLAPTYRQRLVHPPELTEGSDEIAELHPAPAPWDTHCLLLTSGTTGPSKASMTTHAYVATLADFLVDECAVGPDDVFQADMPWFHLSALAPAIQIMRVGGTIALRAVPAMTRYWETAKELGSTFAIAPGTVSQFLAAQPPSASDRDHWLRFMLCSPLPDDPPAFMDRFGLSGLVTAYGSTETNLPTTSTLVTPWRTGSCGKARPGFEIRVVDEHDIPVPAGQVGELIVRADRPWLQSQGYFERPEDTVRAWRNGWFHTGDAFRVDPDGYYYFQDRYKDVVRRRGENISSYEVEREVIAYPGVAEAACVAYPSELGGDDEVKVFMVAESGAHINFDELVPFLVERMTYFMVPRYYELISELPKTPTQRAQKHLLRERGNCDATWDRERAGYQVTRAGLAIATTRRDSTPRQ
jgi:crotonobetaine/carnitine-CoA ligase